MLIRNTNQRKIIKDIMTDNFTHPTADEIYERARALDSHISRGTVYRNLAMLVDNGSIIKIPVPGGADHYDSVVENHYHFSCTGCGRIFDVPSGTEIKTEAIVGDMESRGFLLRGHSLIFTGLCPGCNIS